MGDLGRCQPVCPSISSSRSVPRKQHPHPATKPPGQAHSYTDYRVLFIFLVSYLFIWLHRVLVAARRIFDLRRRIWGLFPQPGIEPSPPALEVQSLGPWTTGEVPPRPHLNATFPTHPPHAPAALLLPDALDPWCSSPDITAPPWPLP